MEIELQAQIEIKIKINVEIETEIGLLIERASDSISQKKIQAQITRKSLYFLRLFLYRIHQCNIQVTGCTLYDHVYSKNTSTIFH